MDFNKLIPDNVSKFDNVYDVLKERGFIEQSTDEDKVRELLQNEKVKFYIGFDPTADCLHVGHFMQVIIMMYMQKFGHTPVVLIGGGTGMVGDPSGRTDMRQVMDIETIEHNCEQFKKLFDQFLDFDEEWKYEGNEGVYVPGHQNKEPEPGKAVAVNNARWLRPLNYIDFLREVGSQFNVNTMLRAECFKQRMEREGGLTMFELNYMLMQSYDFMVMARDFDVKIQFGGNDQWSNIIGGVDLTRKLCGDEVFGLTVSLLLKSDGQKMGKTVGGALWLDERKTPVYDFFQYWRNVDDADVMKCLRMLTFLPIEQIDEMETWPDEKINVKKEILAYELTTLVHGDKEALQAQQTARSLFSGGAAAIAPEVVLSDADFNAEGRIAIADILVKTKQAPSKGEARRLVDQKGIFVADKLVENATMTYSKDEINGAIVKKGKKSFIKITVK